MVSQVVKETLPFEVAEYQERLVNVRKLMEVRGIDYLLINDPVDLNYLLGYRSWGYTFMEWQIYIIPLEKDPILVTRMLESTPFKYQTIVDKMITFGDADDPMDKTIEVLNSLGLANKSIAFPLNSWFMN